MAAKYTCHDGSLEIITPITNWSLFLKCCWLCVNTTAQQHWQNHLHKMCLVMTDLLVTNAHSKFCKPKLKRYKYTSFRICCGVVFHICSRHKQTGCGIKTDYICFGNCMENASLKAEGIGYILDMTVILETVELFCWQTYCWQRGMFVLSAKRISENLWGIQVWIFFKLIPLARHITVWHSLKRQTPSAILPLFYFRKTMFSLHITHHSSDL